MIDALTHLCVEAEAGGFQVEAVWPAGRPPYLVFEIIGDTTPRGLAAAIELREMFAANPAHAESLFEYLLSTGAMLHPVTDPQKLFPAGTRAAAPEAYTPSAALPAWNDLPDVCRSAMCRAVEFHECDGQAALEVLSRTAGAPATAAVSIVRTAGDFNVRHLDVALAGTATALLIAMVLLMPFGGKPKCFKANSSPVFCKVTR